MALAKTAESALRGRPEAEDTLGWVYLKRGQPRDAIPAFERAIAQTPQKSAYHHHLGLAHAQAGNTAKAATAFRRALTLGLSGADATAAQAALRDLASKDVAVKESSR